MKHITKTGCDKKYFFNRNALDSFQLRLDPNKPYCNSIMMLPYFKHSSLLSSTAHFSSYFDSHLCYLLSFYLQYLTRIFIYHPTSSGSNTTIRIIIFQSTLPPISFPLALALALAFFSFSFFSLLNSAWLVSSIDENKIHILIYTLTLIYTHTRSSHSSSLTLTLHPSLSLYTLNLAPHLPRSDYTDFIV